MERAAFRQGIRILDGGMGTALQQAGAPVGVSSELLNFAAPELILKVQEGYLAAGSEFLYTNTFGANRFKLAGTGRTVEETVKTAVSLTRQAAAGRAYTVLDIGPLGKLLEPLGQLTFEEAYDCFKEIVLAGKDADCAVIETMADLYEVKAALLAVKENSNLPVLVTMSFEKNGRTYTGCTAASFARTVSLLGADAVGLNCSLGPAEAVPVIREIASNTELPVICKPNAGLPDPITGKFTLTPEEFAEAMGECVRAGAAVLGGCCGTDSRYIAALEKASKAWKQERHAFCRKPFLCTPTVPLYLDTVRVIGERVNPTGKKRLQQALREKDMDYIAALAVSETDAGAEILDVNAGLPGVSEKEMLPLAVRTLQAATEAPLMIDTTDPEALEAALRVVNGVPAVNSVNGSEESLRTVLPLVKKYGASVVGLCLDGTGMPKTAEERIAVAEKIMRTAEAYGIGKERVFIDCLTLTVSAQPEQAEETLKAVRYVREVLGLETVLGVSNISFGLPNRTAVTGAFLLEALRAGLTLPIMNPNTPELMLHIASHHLLKGEDPNCERYMALAGAAVQNAPAATGSSLTLAEAVKQGLSGEAGRLAKEALEKLAPMELVETVLIPSLNEVGEGYEAGRIFLPGLLSAAKAAGSALEVLRTAMASTGSRLEKGTVALATVRGDIHDIGKNIVKTVLESYGYRVMDLGKDVPPEKICEAVRENGLKLVGLSALMTTTLPAMAETVAALKKLPEPPKVMVGGAVVTAKYAESIGADFYGRDAGQSAAYTGEVLG